MVRKETSVPLRGKALLSAPGAQRRTYQNDLKPQCDPPAQQNDSCSPQYNPEVEREGSGRAIQSKRYSSIARVTHMDTGLGNTWAHPSLSSTYIYLPPQFRHSSRLKKKKVLFVTLVSHGLAGTPGTHLECYIIFVHCVTSLCLGSVVSVSLSLRMRMQVSVIIKSSQLLDMPFH